MDNETPRDEQGRFTSSSQSSSQVPLGTLTSQRAYNEARDNGATETVSVADLEDAKPPEITGTETTAKEYNEKRDEQQRRSKGSGGVQRKIDRLHKERETFREEAETLRAQLARYEAGGEGNRVEMQGQDAEVRSALPQRSEPREPKTAALRERYGDYDQVVESARGMRISDDAAQVMHSLENGGDVAYFLAKNHEFRDQFNKLSPQDQTREIRTIAGHIGDIHSGRRPFAQKVEAAMSKEEISDIVEAAKKNQIGERVVLTLVRELDALPNGPDVMKHLVMDPDESRRLDAMPMAAAVLELGRISARLEHNRSQVWVSKSAPPIKPVNSGSTRSTVPLDKVTSMAEYNRLRDAGRTR